MSDQNISALQIQRSMKTARTKIHNIESKYGAVDIPKDHPLWQQRQVHKDYLTNMRYKLIGQDQPG